jgi:hypothetical protein
MADDETLAARIRSILAERIDVREQPDVRRPYLHGGGTNVLRHGPGSGSPASRPRRPWYTPVTPRVILESQPQAQA